MTHNGGGSGWFPVTLRSDESGDDGEGLSGHYSTGLGGLLAIIFVLFFLYPVLVVVTRPLYPLSSTAIVTLGLTGWILAWVGLEMLVRWGTG